MSSNGKIYITITDERAAAPTIKGKMYGTEMPAYNPLKMDDSILPDVWASNQIINEVKKVLTQASEFSMNNIGNFYGRYDTQEDINNARYAVNTILNIGKTALAGAVMAGPMGAFLGMSLSVINQATTDYYSKLSQVIQNNKTNYQIGQLRNRAGLNALLDGSRGTEN